jgi:hypothetical protein
MELSVKTLLNIGHTFCGLELKHKELHGLIDHFTAMPIFVHQMGIVVVMSLLPHATKHLLKFFQWCFFLHTILFVLNKILESLNHLCRLYILPYRMTAFLIDFASITSSTCVNAG